MGEKHSNLHVGRCWKRVIGNATSGNIKAILDTMVLKGIFTDIFEKFTVCGQGVTTRSIKTYALVEMSSSWMLAFPEHFVTFFLKTKI